jgi:hypothetical protein
MSIRKRTWKSNVTEQTAWVVDYVDQSGKRRLKTFVLKKDAEAWATIARHEVAQGLHASVTKINVEEMVTLWIQHSKDEGLERGTIEQRAQHLRLHIVPFIGREKLATLTTPRVNAFLDQLRDAGRSVAMRRKILTSVRSALAFARGCGLVAQNVASGIKVKSDARHTTAGPLRAGQDFPTKAELKLLIDRAPERWRPFFVTAIFTGMRASELRGLRWSDVDLDAGTIHVRQRADKWGGRITKVRRWRARYSAHPDGGQHPQAMESRSTRRINICEWQRPRAVARNVFFARMEAASTEVWNAALRVSQPAARCGELVHRDAGMEPETHPSGHGPLIDNNDLRSLWSSV